MTSFNYILDNDDDDDDDDWMCTNGHDLCYLGSDPNCPYCERRPKKEQDPDRMLEDMIEREWSD